MDRSSASAPQGRPPATGARSTPSCDQRGQPIHSGGPGGRGRSAPPMDTLCYQHGQPQPPLSPAQPPCMMPCPALPSATIVDGPRCVAAPATRIRRSSSRGHFVLPAWTPTKGLSPPGIRQRPARFSPIACYRRGRLAMAAACLPAQAQVPPAWTASAPLPTARHASRRATTVDG
jgi:hypothetical protein